MKPGLVPALLVFAIYLVVVVGLQQIIGPGYTEVTNSIDDFRDGVVIPVGVASLFVAIATTSLGWWRPAMFETRRTPAWLIAWPVLTIVAMGINIAVDADQWDADFLVMVLVGMTLVGFSEELMTRGLLLTGARGQYKEVVSWLISTGCFALMHGANALDGQDLATTAQQVVSTFGTGTLLYFARRLTGTLLVSMAIHALFDATIVIHAGPGTEFNTDAVAPPVAPGLFQTLGLIFCLIAVVKYSLLRKGEHVEN